MNRNLLIGLLAVVCYIPQALSSDSPSVFIEELTWTELRDVLEEGYDTIIIPTGGTEQNGPHMILGKHNVIVRHAAEQMARRLGDTLVAPVVAYVPEGSIDPPSGHMKFPGTITLPEDVFVKLIGYAARSFKLHGFRNIVLIGDSGGNLNGLKTVSINLNREWKHTDTRVFFLGAFTRGDRFRKWLISQGETPSQIGYHAGVMDTSVAMAVDPNMVRVDKLAPGNDFNVSGVAGDPRRASAAYGEKGLEIQIDGAIRQLRAFLGNRSAATD